MIGLILDALHKAYNILWDLGEALVKTVIGLWSTQVAATFQSVHEARDSWEVAGRVLMCIGLVVGGLWPITVFLSALVIPITGGMHWHIYLIIIATLLYIAGRVVNQKGGKK